MKRIVGALLLLGSLVWTVSARTPERVEPFTLNDITGKAVSLDAFKDSKAIVLMFIATQCPVSNAYNERYVALYNDYAKKNIVFLGINSNKQESVAEITSHAKEHGFRFPILKDVNNIVADKLDAQHTPEIFVVLPPAMTVVYHGRIDDSRREKDITSNDLRDALDEILSGQPVSVKETKAFGCSIKRVE